MNIENYQQSISSHTMHSQLKDTLIEQLELFCTLSEIHELSFYKYNYEYNDFIFDFGVDDTGHLLEESDQFNQPFSILLQYKEIILGKIYVPKRLKGSYSLIKLLKKVRKNLLKQYEFEKEFYGAQSLFNIYVIHDEALAEFSKSLSSGLKGMFNVDVYIDTQINQRITEIQSKDMKHILIYVVNDQKTLEKDRQVIEKLNDLVIVVGPNDHDLSIYSGKLGIEHYIPIHMFKPEEIKKIILEKRHTIMNKNKFDNKIIAFAGIAGGIGTTTLAMNTANELAKSLTDKNILFIDLASSKAVSNLFLEQNPLPDKSILDLINSAEFNIEKNLENGLVKITENFYSINGIQRHIDKELLEQNIFIEKLLDYIVQASEYFNFIIIDTGSADAANLKTTVYDLVNEIWLISEMNLPHISKLKTFYNLMKRAGLREKISFLFNRYDSENAMSASDVTSILNMSKEDQFYFDYRIPNDYKTLGKAWNYCELVTNTDRESLFVRSLEDILSQKGFYTKKVAEQKPLSGIFSLFKGKKS